MKVNAYAKINLGLDVILRRPDGYHEVRMVMQTVGLHDVIDVTRTDEAKISITTDSEDIPSGDDNLIYKAAELIMKEYSLSGGLKIDLTKNIPVAAGLAGGSTDAAATLKAVNALYDLKLPDEELSKLGVRIGADVPYCIRGGTVLCEGIGEIMTGISPCPKCTVLLAKPREGMSTAYVYKHLDLTKVTHPDIDGLIRSIENGSIKDASHCMGNVLETVTVPELPVIGRIKKTMTDNGATACLMSGSGPTVFGLFDGKEAAMAASEELEVSEEGLRLIITDIYNPER